LALVQAAVVPRLAQLLRQVVVAVAQLELVVGNPELLALVVAAERMLLALVVLEIRHQLPQAKEIMAELVGRNLERTVLEVGVAQVLSVKRVPIRLAELVELELHQHF
jgi:hypothetical protein